MRNKILVVFVILFAFLIRIYNLDRIVGFDYDQEVAANWIKNLLVDHKFSLIGQGTSVNGVFMAPFFYYLSAPLYWLSGLNPFAGNIFVILISVLTMIYLYKWSKSLIVLFLYALHPKMIYFDQTMAPSGLVLLIASAVGYYLTKSNKKFYDYLFLSIFLGLTFSAHPPSVLLILLTLIIFWKQKEKLKNYFLMTLPLFILVAPLIIFYLRHGLPVIASSSYYPFAFRAVVNFNLMLMYWASTLVYSDLFFIKFPLMILVIYLFWKVKDGLFRWWLILPFGFLVLYPHPAPEYYLQMIMPAVLIYSVKYLAKPILMAIIILSLAVSVLILPNRENLTGLYYKNQVAEYLTQKNPAMVYFSADPGQNWGFSYLFWWHQVKFEKDSARYQIIVPASREPATSGVVFGNIKVARL